MIEALAVLIPLYVLWALWIWLSCALEESVVPNSRPPVRNPPSPAGRSFPEASPSQRGEASGPVGLGPSD